MANPYWNSCEHVKNIIYTSDFKKYRPAIFKCKCCSKLLCTECVFTCSSCKKITCHDCIGFTPNSDKEEYPKQIGSMHCIDCEPERQYPASDHRPISKEWLDSPKTSPRAFDNFLTGSPPSSKNIDVFSFPNFSDVFFVCKIRKILYSSLRKA